MHKLAAPQSTLGRIWKHLRRNVRASKFVLSPSTWRTRWKRGLQQHPGSKALALLDTIKSMQRPLTGAAGILGTTILAKKLYDRTGSQEQVPEYGGGGYEPPF